MAGGGTKRQCGAVLSDRPWRQIGYVLTRLSHLLSLCCLTPPCSVSSSAKWIGLSYRLTEMVYAGTQWVVVFPSLLSMKKLKDREVWEPLQSNMDCQQHLSVQPNKLAFQWKQDQFSEVLTITTITAHIYIGYLLRARFYIKSWIYSILL